MLLSGQLRQEFKEKLVKVSNLKHEYFILHLNLSDLKNSVTIFRNHKKNPANKTKMISQFECRNRYKRETINPTSIFTELFPFVQL